MVYRSVAVGEQLLPLELTAGCSDEDQLQPTKSVMDAVDLSLDQVSMCHKAIITFIQVTCTYMYLAIT